jgi:hypothetical protein
MQLGYVGQNFADRAIRANGTMSSDNTLKLSARG